MQNNFAITSSQKKTFCSTELLKKMFAIVIALFIVLRIPKVLGIGTIYQTTYITRLIGDFSVDYIFTIFDLFVIALGCFFYAKYRVVNVIPFLFVLITYNIFRFFFRASNIFDLNSFEVVFSIFVVLSCGNIVAYYFRTAKEIMTIFKILVSVLFLTQLLYFIMGKSGTGDKDYGSGYGALGINSGSLGLVYSIFALLLISSKEKNIVKVIFLIIVLIGLFLTGSRTNLFLFVVFLFLLFIFKSKAKTKAVIFFLCIFAIPLIIIFAQRFLLSNIKFYTLLELFEGNFLENVLNNLSVQERIDSWKIAFEIIKDNPLGISASATDLTTQMFNYGGVTFPHSYLISYYLMFGIGGLIVYFAFWLEFIKSIKNNTGIEFCWLYLIFVVTFYGGISTEYILFCWFYLFYIYSKTIDKDINTFKKTKLCYGKNALFNV